MPKMLPYSWKCMNTLINFAQVTPGTHLFWRWLWTSYRNWKWPILILYMVSSLTSKNTFTQYCAPENIYIYYLIILCAAFLSTVCDPVLGDHGSMVRLLSMLPVICCFGLIDFLSFTFSVLSDESVFAHWITCRCGWDLGMERKVE